jgi:hypothetical protein
MGAGQEGKPAPNQRVIMRHIIGLILIVLLSTTLSAGGQETVLPPGFMMRQVWEVLEIKGDVSPNQWFAKSKPVIQGSFYCFETIAGECYAIPAEPGTRFKAFLTKISVAKTLVPK